MTGAASRVAIQGERGAFSHQAALQVVGDATEIVACRTFEALFDAVADGSADVGMVPVENTLAGAVQRPMDLLAARDVWAFAETRVPIRLCFTVRPGTTLDDVTFAASHPVALQQCLRFFEAHARIRTKAVYDTAGSVRDLMSGEADYQAAIGSELAAELYGAEILVRGLEDDQANYTRFLAVRARGDADDPPLEGNLKTSIVFTTSHTPGALHAALGCLADAGVDLTRLESRPIPGRPWEYRFYADLRGADADTQDRALDALRDQAGELRILGRYRESTQSDVP